MVNDPQILAQRAATAMLARDPASQNLGIALVAIRPGYAHMRMTVRADMLNGHATCHGGYIFMLADSAFAFACNSYNQITVGAGCTIDYIVPALEGDQLDAEATEQAIAVNGKSGVYDVKVTNQNAFTVALFRGKSHRVGGTLLDLTFEASKENT